MMTEQLAGAVPVTFVCEIEIDSRGCHWWIRIQQDLSIAIPVKEFSQWMSGWLPCLQHLMAREEEEYYYFLHFVFLQVQRRRNNNIIESFRWWVEGYWFAANSCPGVMFPLSFARWAKEPLDENRSTSSHSFASRNLSIRLTQRPMDVEEWEEVKDTI